MNHRSVQMKKQMLNQIAKQQQEALKKHLEEQQEANKKEEIKRIRNKLAQDERLQMEYNLMKHRLQQKGK
jgi:biopolymer transport protein ExbB/TolQ